MDTESEKLQLMKEFREQLVNFLDEIPVFFKFFRLHL